MTRIALRVLAAAALGISSYVHLHVAHLYSYGSTITGTDMFIGQGVVAALVAVVLVVTGNRWAWVVAALVGLASFGAVMLYRYVDVGAIGPLPNMYDATWQPSPDKIMSAIAEICIPVLWLLHLASRRTSNATKPAARRVVEERRPVDW
jgi:hypothetical protein